MIAYISVYKRAFNNQVMYFEDICNIYMTMIYI